MRQCLLGLIAVCAAFTATSSVIAQSERTPKFQLNQPVTLEEPGDIVGAQMYPYALHDLVVDEPRYITQPMVPYRVDLLDSDENWRSYRIVLNSQAYFVGMLEVISREGDGEFRFYPFTGTRMLLNNLQYPFQFDLTEGQITLAFNMRLAYMASRTVTFDIDDRKFVDGDVPTIESGGNLFFPVNYKGDFQGLWKYSPDSQWSLLESPRGDTYDDFAESQGGLIRIYFVTSRGDRSSKELLFDPKTLQFVDN